MRAMQLERPLTPLREHELPVPVPRAGQLLLEVGACGVCRTDLHIVDGELTRGKLPVTPGHEIVGTVVALGADVEGFHEGQRVGVPWLGETCGRCRFCLSGRENLCATDRVSAGPIAVHAVPLISCPSIRTETLAFRNATPARGCNRRA